MTTDFDFINSFVLSVDRKRKIDPAYVMTSAERVASNVWDALGISGNGSFQYFFECGLDAKACAEAYEAIGLTEGARLFKLALSLFPDSSPHLDAHERLALTQEH